MSTILDHVNDTNSSELFRLRKLYDFPDFVKSASPDDTLRPEGLLPTVYADPVGRRFPCHSPASTWLSSLFFAEKRGSYHPKIAARVEQRLNHFVGFWGIKEAAEQLKTRYDALYKNADDKLPDSDFAVVYELDNGTKERHCRMKNALETKTAAAWLQQYRDQLPFKDRNTIALKIAEKAARYGASLGEHDVFVAKQAGHGVCQPSEVVQMLRDRAKLAKFAEHKVAMTKLADTVASKPRAAFDPSMLVKLAETVDVYDRAVGLAGRYTDNIQRPEDVIFKVTYKEAKAAVGDACGLTTGNIYDRTEFKKIALEDVKALFGQDLAAAVADGLNIDITKLAEVVETLPRGDAELFEKLLQETGIPPIATKRADDHNGIPSQALVNLAAGYRQ